MARAPVRLNVYDMYWLNEYASNIGVGIFHTGIEVYGVEYAYGGHPFQFSGVFENTPQDAEELGENFKFKESILIGETDFAAGDVREMIKALGEEFRGDRYHLISRNCNHFTSTLARTLTGREIPGWINRLAAISGSIPFLERVLPQEWLTPVALQASLDKESHGSRVSVDSAEEAYEAPKSSASSSNGRIALLNGKLPNGFERRQSNGATANGASTSNGGSSASSSVSTASATSAPTTARSSSPTPISRLWNSIRGLAITDSPQPNS